MSFKAEKDPNARLDYSIDWSAWLGTDTIATSAWTADTGLTLSGATNDTTSATVWVEGGTAGEVYGVTNTITTAGGRRDERTIKFKIKEQ